jgi:predicted secreted protein
VFEDGRSKRVILVSHCILNQNAKIDACAHYPGVVREVADLILSSGCGIIQMECPEVTHLGLDRQVVPASQRTVESEDTRVADLMEKAAGRACCREIALRVAHQIEQYVRSGFSVLGVLGVNGSPTCGVETGWRAGAEVAEPGVLIRELREACRQRGLSVTTRGLKAKDRRGAAQATREVLGAGRYLSAPGASSEDAPVARPPSGR